MHWSFAAMTPCIHCGSAGPNCDWVAPIDVIDADPPCRAPEYDQASVVEEGWRIFKALLGVEAGILTLVLLFAIAKIY
jgi:hypothetical protein